MVNQKFRHHQVSRKAHSISLLVIVWLSDYSTIDVALERIENAPDGRPRGGRIYFFRNRKQRTTRNETLREGLICKPQSINDADLVPQVACLSLGPAQKTALTFIAYHTDTCQDVPLVSHLA